jgi:hypothetical protein
MQRQGQCHAANTAACNYNLLFAHAVPPKLLGTIYQRYPDWQTA